jgi:hypothetical protein
LAASVIRVVLILAVVVAAAIAANVALLSVAADSHERVGQLSPVLAVSPPSAPSTATTAPAHADESDRDGDADD